MFGPRKYDEQTEGGGNQRSEVKQLNDDPFETNENESDWGMKGHQEVEPQVGNDLAASKAVEKKVSKAPKQEDKGSEEKVKEDALGKKMKKETYFLKIAYRSQIGFLMLIFIGIITMAFAELIATLIITPEDFIKMKDTLSKEMVVKIFFAFGGLFALIGAWKTMIQRLTWKYEIGKLKIRSHEGIIAKNTKGIEYTNIKSVETNRTILGRLFNFGTIELSTAGTSGSEVVISNVYNPEKVRDDISKRTSEAFVLMKNSENGVIFN